ncbi:MAG: InlB B-repeat-containing protein [Clostridia bacterium]|nr:InlB B-repeat-containing protein [Clostridia bacterium]
MFILSNVTFNDTMGEVILNNNFHTQEGTMFSETLPNAGYTDNNKTNKIHVVTSYGENAASKVNINGEEYEYDANGYDVAGSSTYTIVVTGDSSVVTPKTVIWANPDYIPEDEDDAEWVADFTINHGYAKAIAVYDDQNQLLDPSEYTNGESDEFGLKDGLGWVGIYPGSRVIFEFEPEYGYQLTDIKINDEQIDNPTETPNQYEFTMIDGSGNIHFSANFEPTENTQIIGTDASISDMNYTLEDGTLDSGTAVLSIDKVTELSNEQKQGFADVAGSDYEVSTYLDVDLTQVWFKGINAEFGEDGYSENDVWTNEIYDLGDKKATITITLDEGITPDDVVILHEIHDDEGNVTGYEKVTIINKQQDANGIWTVTFETSKFSNYAIAEKKEDTPENYTVTFNTDGGTEIEAQEVASGTTATKPEDPTKDGYTFDGWYADDTFAVEFDFESSITQDTTIYAKWEEISNTDTDTEFEYAIVEGENQTVEAEEGEDLIVKANGSVDKFVKLLVDGEEVDPENYTITSGSTIASLSSSFLNTLSSGNHILTFVYTDGQAQTNFRIASTNNPTQGNTSGEATDGSAGTSTEETTSTTAKSSEETSSTKTSNPKTGDNIYKYVTMFSIATVGLMLTKKNKKIIRNKGKH